ncbi:hypothetical protein ACRALDRAFT_2102829 [Sodiomyces alcalophilus JCM 7366]|uniref:uncharacterized protein n=1 Tax=Sodiomyces alcalophilus JCM 7366 TaxID=591952 RepID=UPI0039B3B7B8
MSTSQQQPAGYSLFPNPNSRPPTTSRPPSRTRRSSSRERTGASGLGAGHHVTDASPPRQGRRTPQHRMHSSIDSTRSPHAHQQTPLDESQPSLTRRDGTPVQVQKPPPAADIPPRSDTTTAFSEAQTLVRSSSNRSRSSIAKLPLYEEPSSPASPQEEDDDEPVLRSIFPQYNHNLPLDRQEYYPTQTSPTHIPRAVINRISLHPGDDFETVTPAAAGSSSVMSPQLAFPQPVLQPQRWPPRGNEMPPLPTESSNEQLKGLWRVVNGWRASPSDGRVYCLKLSQERDAPVYTLSSRQQPFYNLRLDPTSASAYVALSRHDPSKSYKAPPHSSSASSAASSTNGKILSNVIGGKNGDGKATEGKHWQEVLTTTLEEESRRHRPNDGLVALLYPHAASRVALARPDDPAAVSMAEAECARLLWDDDAASHFLVHPALAAPFRVTVDRFPAWSRVEYTLEHHESPRPLARLTRDGTGAGWLELDTTVAAHIDSFFIVDVAVAALLLVAAGDERGAHVEAFEPPPLPPSLLGGGTSSRRSRGRKAKAKGGKKWGGRTRVEEMEMDLESQDGSGLAKLEQVTNETRRKLPWPLRIAFKVLGGVFKCVIWSLTVAFKALGAIVLGVAKCLGLRSKY